MTKEGKTLHLVLKRKWWDMIESGEKKEEYRTHSDYWIKRLVDGEYYGSDDPLISASYEFEYNNNKGKQVGDTIEEALYNLLCWVAINRKELLGIKK